MIDLRWTAPALADLRAVDAWLTREAAGEVAARAVVAIRGRARSLGNFPRLGRLVADRDFRMLRVLGTPYLIVYRSAADRVDILRIRHERENWQLGP